MEGFEISLETTRGDRQRPAQEDHALLDRFHLGDASAFDELVDRYHLPVFHLVYRMTQNRADAEDLTQEVFVKAYRSLRDFHRASSLKTWLFRIAMNLAIDQRRKAQAPLPPFPTSSTWEMPWASLDRWVLREAIARLSAKQRAVLVLRIYHDLSFKEIGETLGSPLGTVKAHYHAAVMRLRSLLQESPHLVSGRP